MSPTPGRGNLRARRSEDHLTRREQAELRPEVERLAAKGLSYREIAEALSTPQRPLNMRKVRTIQYKFGIQSGAKPGRAAGVPDRDGERSGNAVRQAAMKEARAKVRPLIETWIAEKYTDQQMADALNEAGVPTLGNSGQWTAVKVESLRRREGLRAVTGRYVIRQKFVVPRGHDAHCNTCDAPVDYDWFGKAILHQRLTSMLVAGVRRVGRCEGSCEPVVVRLISADTLARAA